MLLILKVKMRKNPFLQLGSCMSELFYFMQILIFICYLENTVFTVH